MPENMLMVDDEESVRNSLAGVMRDSGLGMRGRDRCVDAVD
jgi:DNA-binding NtrC family response regulator